MVERKFVCKACGKVFTARTCEPGEAEEMRKPTGPVRCPACGGVQIKDY